MPIDFPDRTTVEALIDPVSLPLFARVRYEPDTEVIEHPERATRSELADLFSGLETGATVAVGVGSRGIHDLTEIIETTVTYLTEQGYKPIVVPAMGSHGGATADGQREVLAALGVTEEVLEVPIDARMATDPIGEVTIGETTTQVHIGRAVLDADAAFVVNRIKPHTNFTGRVESGLAKMTVVGFGKQSGAKAFHSTAIEEGYVQTLSGIFKLIENEVPLLGGLAIVENFQEKTAKIEWLPADMVLNREPALLGTAYEQMATLPIEDIDLLVVDELGKEVSGAGMDTNVIGRYRVLNTPDPELPDIDLIYVRGLTERTEGNGNGIGLADVTRQAAVDQLDLEKTYANALTSGSLAKSKIPIVAPDDESALRISLSALGGYDPRTARIVWIRDTQDLTTLRVSMSVVEDLPPEVTVETEETLTFENGTRLFQPQ